MLCIVRINILCPFLRHINICLITSEIELYFYNLVLIEYYLPEINFNLHTAYSPWDRSIISILEPSFDMALFQYFWRFAQICKKFSAFAHKIIFVIVSEQFCELLCIKFQKYWNNAMSNDGSSIEIIYQSHGD